MWKPTEIGTVVAERELTFQSRFAFSNVWTGGNKCWCFWATPPAGSGLSASDTVLVNIDLRGSPRKET